MGRIPLVRLAAAASLPVLALVAALAGQPAPTAPATSPGDPPSGEAPTTDSAPYWRSRYGQREVIQRLRPEYDRDYLNNPHKGTTTFQRFNGDPLYPDLRWSDAAGPLTFPPPARKDLSNDRYPPTRIAYCRWIWSVIEPQKGQFRWDVVDEALKTAAARGQTLQVRIQPFVGGNGPPAWYWDTGAARGGRGRREPDHNDPLYIRHWSEHIAAWGKRYDGHPALESFDIAYGGSCGETGGNATAATAAKLVDAYLAAFQKTQLIGMLGTPGNAYAAKVPGRNIGWRADCFGDLRQRGGGGPPDEGAWNHMYDLYPMEVEEQGLKDTWKKAPVILETGWTVPHWRQQGWDLDAILEQGLKYHPSVLMPKSVYIPAEDMDKIMAFNRRLGYRFHVHQMLLPLEGRCGGSITVETVIDNKGVAPIYRPYRFALRLSQQGRSHVVPFAVDIRTWLPDYTFFREKLPLPADLRAGEVKVACAIIDEQDRPVVGLAIKPRDADGWYPLTSLDLRGE